MRICEIELRNGSTDVDVRAMSENLAAKSWMVPDLLSAYLNCIGAIMDSVGTIARHREIVLPSADVVDGVCGFFGRVDVNTHVHYENRPSPGVIAMRIRQDLDMTINDVDADWNLPVDLIPDEENADLPTVNLLGWKCAVTMSAEQQIGLEQCGIMLNPAGALIFPHRYRFCYNNELMIFVDRRINELSARIKCSTGITSTDRGSMCQEDFQTTRADLYFNIGPTEQYGRRGISNCGMASLDMRLDLFAQSFRLRVRKDSFPRALLALDP